MRNASRSTAAVPQRWAEMAKAESMEVATRRSKGLMLMTPNVRVNRPAAMDARTEKNCAHRRVRLNAGLGVAESQS